MKTNQFYVVLQATMPPIGIPIIKGLFYDPLIAGIYYLIKKSLAPEVSNITIGSIVALFIFYLIRGY